jgi:hypothetical protein
MPPTSCAENGEYGFQILKVGISASVSGKGEAVSATSGDATIMWYNPAAVQLNPHSNFCFSHSSYIFENNLENASLIVKKANHSYGLGIIFLNYGKIDSYSENPADIYDVIGEYHPTDILVAGNLAYRILPSLFCGTNLKMVFEKIHTESVVGFSTDFGLLYDSFLKGLNVALVTQNIGFSTKMKNERIKFPITYKIGANYDINVTNQSNISFSIDLVKYIDCDNLKANSGIEYGFADIIYTRLGYKINYDVQDFSAGLGIKLNNYKFDYAFEPFQDELGNAHRFSISYNF